MPSHKIRQEWLTLDEAAEVIRQHNITLLPADLIRHALHDDLSLSVYFPSPVLIRPLNPPCRFACRFSKPPFPPSQCNKPPPNATGNFVTPGHPLKKPPDG